MGLAYQNTRLGGLDNQRLFIPHGSEGCKGQDQGAGRFCALWGKNHPGSWATIFSLCPHKAEG